MVLMTPATRHSDGAPMNTPVSDPAAELAAIAAAVQRLTPSWQFHLGKSEINARLRRLAGLAAGQPWPPPLSRPTPPPRIIRTVEIHVVVLRQHLARRSRHRYPLPPARCEQQLALPLAPSPR